MERHDFTLVRRDGRRIIGVPKIFRDPLCGNHWSRSTDCAVHQAVERFRKRVQRRTAGKRRR